MNVNTGIWIDKRQAKIVSISDGTEHLSTVTSNIEEYRPKGGSGTRLKGGPQDVVQDSKFLEREKQQFKSFFNDVMEHVQDADAVVIFGPAQTGEKLSKEIADSNSELSKKVRAVEKADSMTDNQIKAWVRDFYA